MTGDSHNEISGEVHADVVVQAGTINGGVHLGGGRKAELDYKEQVRRIAPKVLYGRDRELDELGRFCTDATVPSPYQWWQAPAWAGKSALLATFVLHPPPGVRVVSFFITARFADQNDRGAFLSVVVEQLADLLRQPLPQVSGPTAEAHLLGMFRRATGECANRGQRLVLVVDGLDEDRDSDTHSIAALLPEDPEPGMRIIVAGRPHPPIPRDVRRNHPLRDPGVVRVLDRSPHAEAERDEGEQALKRLLGGDDRDKALLGLVVAAGGGLSAADLAQLISPSGDIQPWEVADHLSTVAGRAFSRRLGTDGGDPESALYILAHEELQASAAKFLGPKRLAELRDQVCRWADSQDWSADTPDYLVRGYFRLLQALGDVPRMVDLATDLTRQDWLRDRTGGDAVALSQIASCKEAVLGADEPDLLTALRLAMHHDRLGERNRHIPGDLPEVFARLGRLAQAEALARCLGDRWARDEALLEVARAAVAADEFERAEELAAAIETGMLRSLAGSVLATAKARRAGDAATRSTEAAVSAARERSYASAARKAQDEADAAENLDERLASATAISDRHRRSYALSQVAGLAARRGEIDRAMSIVAVCGDRFGRHHCRKAVVTALAGRADFDRAEALAGTAEHASDQVELLTVVAESAMKSGDSDRAAAVARRAAALARSVGDSFQRSSALVQTVRMFVEAGAPGPAEELVGDITEPRLRMDALVLLMKADPGRASTHIRAVGPVLKSITSHRIRDNALGRLSQGLAAIGRLRHAADVAHEIDGLRDQRPAFRAVVGAALVADDIAAAVGYANEVEDVSTRATLATDVALHCVKTGRVDVAERHGEEALRLAGSISDSQAAHERIETLIGEVAWFGEAGNAAALAARLSAPAGFWRTHAADVLERRLLAKSRRLEPRDHTAVDKNDVARALAEDVGHASLLANMVRNPFDRAAALTMVAEATAAAGDVPLATAFVNLIAMPFHRQAGLLAIVEVIAPFDVGQARLLADLITCPDLGARALAASAKADHAVANELIGQIGSLADTVTEPRRRVSVLVALADVLSVVGDVDRAEDAVRGVDPAGCSLADEDRLMAAIGRVASRHALDGRVERLADLIRSLPNPRNQDQVRATAARAVAKSGAVDHARAIAAGVHNGYTRWQTMIELPSIAAAAGHVDAAEPVAHALTDVLQAYAMVRLARTVARLGDLDRAEELARTASDRPEDVVTALLGIAEFAPDRARRLLATTLRLGHWSRSVRELARMDPVLVVEATEEYLRLLDG